MNYKLVRVASGAQSVHSLAHKETFHPVIGPVAEAEALYVKQAELEQRLAEIGEEFVVWDVGLGAAANVLTLLKAAQNAPGKIRVTSFDNTLEPLAFALEHADQLGYFGGFERHVAALLEQRKIYFQNARGAVEWEIVEGDFPSLLRSKSAMDWPKPHLIMFDAFSPARNCAMWTLPLFRNLAQLLSPSRPCLMPTYSRSTMLRVTLLLAGFFVGVGHPTGEKEETTIAANTLSMLSEPLDRRWLSRVRRSTSAEPMIEPVYRQAPLSPEHWAELEIHPQFHRQAG